MRRLPSILCLGIAFLTCCPLSAASKRALVIGIGVYPAGSGWATINGDKDIPLVEDILLTNGFLPQDIVVLANAQATASAIRNAFHRLIDQAQIGDIVYVHFSGHGQQVTDLHGDEPDGLDEAWVPYDAQLAYVKGQYEGQNHIIDDELNRYLHALRRRVGTTGKIIVIADACHSGDSTRGDDSDELNNDLSGNTSSAPIVIRGTADAFIIPPTATTQPHSSPHIPATASPHTPATASPATPTVAPIDWVLISACKPYQSNREYQGHGSLTTALLGQKSNLSTLSCTQLSDTLTAAFRSFRIYSQTPIIELPATPAPNTLF